MIIIPCYASDSRIHGTGLFSSSEVKKGDVIWRYDPSTDIKIPKEFVDSWEEKSKSYIQHFCVLIGDDYLYSLDNSIYVNHSDDPNMGPFGSYEDIVALRDISPGEEITTRYFEKEKVTP